jgi:hypothetical protein
MDEWANNFRLATVARSSRCVSTLLYMDLYQTRFTVPASLENAKNIVHTSQTQHWEPCWEPMRRYPLPSIVIGVAR